MDYSKMSMRELKKQRVILTPELAENIHREILRKMSPKRKAEIRRQFFELANKLNELNDRRKDGK